MRRFVYASNLHDVDALKVNYANTFYISTLDRKRAVEIFSPLNPKMTGSYSYKNAGTAKISGERVRVVDSVR